MFQLLFMITEMAMCSVNILVASVVAIFMWENNGHLNSYDPQHYPELNFDGMHHCYVADVDNGLKATSHPCSYHADQATLDVHVFAICETESCQTENGESCAFPFRCDVEVADP